MHEDDRLASLAEAGEAAIEAVVARGEAAEEGQARVPADAVGEAVADRQLRSTSSW